MKIKIYVFLVMVLATMGSFVLMVPVFAVGNQQMGNDKFEQKQEPAVVGIVSAINGNTITVTGKQNSENTNTNTVFTVNVANASITKNGVVITVSGITIGDTVVVKGTITGTNIVATTIRDGQSKKGEIDSNEMRPNVVGKVSAISGNIITIIGKQGFNKTGTNTTTTFTVDATNAKLLRGNTVITLSNIAVGDTVVVQGTVTGTNVVATIIRDGKMGAGNSDDNNQALMQIQGNGQPVIAGTISAINGSTLTVTNSSVTYTVNAINSKIVQGKTTILTSDVKIGDSVIVQGTINGTSVVASIIFDQNNPANKNTEKTQNPRLGFFASMGQFFRRLFGF